MFRKRNFFAEDDSSVVSARLELPSNVVEGSARAEVTAIGMIFTLHSIIAVITALDVDSDGPMNILCV